MVRSTSSSKRALDGAAPANPKGKISKLDSGLIPADRIRSWISVKFRQAEFVAHSGLMGRASDKSQIF